MFSDVVSTEEMTVKEFKIFDQRFNTKILKFIKVLNCTINKSMVSNILESKSIALEYISLMRLKQVYQNFLQTKFKTTINFDMNLLVKPPSG